MGKEGCIAANAAMDNGNGCQPNPICLALSKFGVGFQRIQMCERFL